VIAMASCFLGLMTLSGCVAAAQDRAQNLPSAPEPPDSTLLSGERAGTGQIGSYCWSSGSGGSCVDAVYPLVPGKEKTLAVEAGSGMVFDYGGEAPPDSVHAGAEPLGPGGEPADSLSSPLEVDGSGDRVTIPAELATGDYVVDVSVTVPEGDASYYFRVVVERDEVALPETGGP
jgi:hypothetical protein